MSEAIDVTVASAEAADHGVAELSAGGKPIGYTIIEDGEVVLHLEPPGEHAPVVVGARSLAQALMNACHLLEKY